MSTAWFIAGCLVALSVGVVVGNRMRRVKDTPAGSPAVRESEGFAGNHYYVVILQDPLPAGTLFEYPGEEAESVAVFRQRLREAYERHSGKSPRYFVGWVDVEREFRIIAEVEGELSVEVATE